jgi:glycosidase
MKRSRLASFLLLTMPGVPFVYYGEEIGMVGAKPDERLRTPMQWRAAHAGGFTTGTPWETLQADSLTTTVEAEDADSGSVLTMNRRLIHLRAVTPALGEGKLVPLEASAAGVAAYARRSGDRVVLVVANLTSQPLRGVTMSAAAGSLPAGAWRVRSMLDGRRAGSLRVGTDGRFVNYSPMAELGPLEGYVLELRR